VELKQKDSDIKMPEKTKEVGNLKNFEVDSRYKKYKIFYDKDIEMYFHDLPKMRNIQRSKEDLFYTVTVIHQNRLDLIANLFYKNSRLWWVIAEANSLNDPFNVPIGLTLVIPNPGNIFGAGGIV
jgi:nucleoid-associated protein YgaU